jgi:mono/diheme cytochrome c family protein
MRRQIRFSCAAALGLAVLAGWSATSRAQTPTRTVWDGVYTAEQAARGKELYKTSCGYCHRDDLTGGGSEAGAPALTGPIFVYRWAGQPAADVFLSIGLTMPKNKPDTLTPAVVADILSFILQSNEMPPGDTELLPDLDALGAIAMTERPAADPAR